MVASEAVVVCPADGGGQGLIVGERLADFRRCLSWPIWYLADTFVQRPGRCEEQALPGFMGLLLGEGVSVLNLSEEV
jgi:hypothetical protein